MKLKITVNDFAQRIAARFPGERFKVLEYSGTGNPAKIRCESCGKVISVKAASNFLCKNKVYGCKDCHEGRWNREEKTKLLLSKYEIEQAGVSGTHKRYKFTCRNCGAVRYGTRGNVLRHIECRCEGRANNWTVEEINKKLAGRYEVVGDMPHGVLEKTRVKCLKCGEIWFVRPNDLLYSWRQDCPRCHERDRESLGEAYVAKCLDEMKVKYFREYQMENSLQRFDFLIKSHNVAIEYNGAQHYRYVPMFHKTEDGFIRQQMRDEKKREYCKDHGITLIEIPYTFSDEEIRNCIESSLSGSTTIA